MTGTRSTARAPSRAAVALGLIANLPLALFVLLDAWVGWTQLLWIGARDDLLAYGAAGLGPLLGCFAILVGRRWGGHGAAGSTFAQAAGWLSIVSGVVVGFLVRGLTGPWLFWSPMLLAVMLLVVSERDPPK